MEELRQDAEAPGESFLTADEVRKQLGISLHEVYKLIRARDIQAVNVAPSDNPGGRACWRIRQQWVDDFIAQRLAAGKPQPQESRRARSRACASSGLGSIPNYLGF